MIQISQEELFRKIELEHRLEEDEEEQGESRERGRTFIVKRHSAGEVERLSFVCEDDCENHTKTTATRRESCSTAGHLRLVSGSRNPIVNYPSSSSAATFAGRQEMSSILPRTTYKNLTRDKNNNSAAPDEDEVQAVLITGCGSKIGSNIAVAFAARGLKVALVDFDTKQTEAVARECQDKSPKNRVPLQIVADISQLAEAHKVIDRTIEAFGRLDVLVNTVNNASLMAAKFNSGSGDDDPHVFEQYHKIIASNMHSVTYLCISAAPYLRKTKGSIVNVSSITNNETGSYKFAYCMSKAGISTLTKCLATDLAPDIKVICVSPKSDA